MAFKAQEIPSVISTGQISSSRGASSDNTFETLFKGAGATLSAGLDAKVETDMTNISLSASDSADALANELLGTQGTVTPASYGEYDEDNLPSEIQARAGEVSRYAGAAKVRPELNTLVSAKLWASTKDMQAKYHYLRDKIPGIMMAAAGNNAGIQYAQDLADQADAADANLAADVKASRAYYNANKDEIAWAKQQGFIGDDVTPSNINIDEAEKKLTPIRAHAYDTKVQADEMSLSRNKAKISTNTSVNNYLAEQTGFALTQGIKQLGIDPKSSAPLTTEQQEAVRNAWGSMKANLRVGALALINGNAAFLETGDQEAAIKQVDEYIKTMDEYFVSPTTGKLNALDNWNKSVVTGKTNELLKDPINVVRAGLKNVGWSDEVVDTAIEELVLGKGGVPGELVANMVKDHLTRDGVTFKSQHDAAQRTGYSKEEADAITRTEFEATFKLLENPEGDLDKLEIAFKNIYVNPEGVSTIRSFSPGNPLAMYSKMFSPAMTARFKDTKYFPAYTAAARAQFANFAKPLADEIVAYDQIPGTYYDIVFNEQSGAFEPKDFDTSWMNYSIAGTSGIGRKIDQFNAYVGLMKPILDAQKISPADFVRVQMGGYNPNEVKQDSMLRKMIDAIGAAEMPEFNPPGLKPKSKTKTDTHGSLPRGIRNNNPGNIEYGNFAKRRGATGSDGRFAKFSTPEAGIDSMRDLLASYQSKGLTTVSQMINRWAPSAENDTSAYAKAVAKGMGIKPDEPFSMSDPVLASKMIAAMIKHENGQNPYSTEEIELALAT